MTQDSEHFDRLRADEQERQKERVAANQAGQDGDEPHYEEGKEPGHLGNDTSKMPLLDTDLKKIAREGMDDRERNPEVAEALDKLHGLGIPNPGLEANDALEGDETVDDRATERSSAGAAAGASAADDDRIRADVRDDRVREDVREDRVGDDHVREDRVGDDSDAQWWAGLSPEDRYAVIESVRLDQDPEPPATFERPTGARADFVRNTPEYHERFAGADHIARQDDAGFGRGAVPAAHEDTAPLDDERRGR